MNKKTKNIIGFTLVEMLGVIIILLLILILVLPRIINSVDNYSAKTDELTFTILKNAAKQYMEDNSVDFPKKEENEYCIKISELIKMEYLKKDIKYNNVDISGTKSIKVTYNNGFDYELIDSDSCLICSGVTSANRTFGNIPKGQFNPGDEYICNVNEEISYNFFVLNKEGTKINLIMGSNLENTVSWGESTTLGPINALNKLESDTETWTNIDLEDYMIIDETGNNYTVFRTNVRARLLTYKEAINLHCLEHIDGESDSLESCASWLYGNLSSSNAYWLSSSVSGTAKYAWYLTNQGDLRYQKNVDEITETDITNNDSYGVRPVISVSISKMAN